MHLIGLTGGIGSGKSMVAGLFNTLGIPVYDSDIRAKALMHDDPEIRSQIVSAFGPEAYNKDHNLNSKWLASHVFNEKGKLEALNKIVHPAVRADLLQWAASASYSQAPYLIQESAIIFEAGLAKRFKYIITVVAPAELRIARVIKRDNSTEESVKRRMTHQWPDDQKIALSDFVIYNDGERSPDIQVKDIDQMIRTLLQSKGG